MQIDIALTNAKIYNIEKADIVKGEEFTLYSDFDNGRWFSDNDEVISLKVSGKDAEAKANENGTTTILIMDSAFAIQKTITINVVDEISPMAASLGASAGPPQPK